MKVFILLFIDFISKINEMDHLTLEMSFTLQLLLSTTNLTTQMSFILQLLFVKMKKASSFISQLNGRSY